VERWISTASGSERGFPYEPRSLPLAVLIRETYSTFSEEKYETT